MTELKKGKSTVALKSNTLVMEIGEVPIGTHFKSSIEGLLNIIKKMIYCLRNKAEKSLKIILS
jgi:hypothetical protein